MLSLIGGKIKNFSMFVLKENQYFYKVVCEKKQAVALCRLCCWLLSVFTLNVGGLRSIIIES